ncbi:MAG: hypothetical protein IKL98_02030 [Akkermansia sp.]|nr:hypothetical protein [Akkermansia sp.]
MGMLTNSKQSRILELPEVITGMLAMLIVLWEAFVAGFGAVEAERALFMEGSHLLLCGVVWFNTIAVIIHFFSEIWRHNKPVRFLWLQLLTGLVASFVFSGGIFGFLPDNSLRASMILSFLLGTYACINIRALIKEKQKIGKKATHSRWAPAVVFFSGMLTMVMISTLILITPGACIVPISFTDAFFTCASAISITGLTSVDVGSTFTPLGKLVVLFNIQVGAIGVMTFSYFVLLLVGKKLAVRDRLAISALLDQQGVNIIPALIKTVIFITFSVEIIGACILYLLWQGVPGVPQDLLWFRSLFHAISAFCNAGITLFPDNMAEECVRYNKAVQAVMMLLTLAGTLGFGVYLECYTRLRNKLTRKANPVRWSTHTWLVIRATIFVMLLGTVGLSLLSVLEPSQHTASADYNIWESIWNTIGRSAGFNITDISSYGPVYHIFLCALMFIGGNPAGTGGGVYAPLFIICLLEVIRVLRGQHDLELHKRRIARNTVERAMATVVLSTFWIVCSTMVLMLLEPSVANSYNGTIKLLFLEVSAFTTTGYSLINPGELTVASKYFLCANMLFGRVGMFTFMLIFIKQKEPSPIRYPETRLPLS